MYKRFIYSLPLRFCFVKKINVKKYHCDLNINDPWNKINNYLDVNAKNIFLSYGIHLFDLNKCIPYNVDIIQWDKAYKKISSYDLDDDNKKTLNNINVICAKILRESKK